MAWGTEGETTLYESQPSSSSWARKNFPSQRACPKNTSTTHRLKGRAAPSRADEEDRYPAEIGKIWRVDLIRLWQTKNKLVHFLKPFSHALAVEIMLNVNETR